jgi:iron complex outermembrane receptor protein
LITRNLFAACAASALSFAAAGNAAAQTANAATPAEASVGEVVVTAEKRTEKLQDVPISMEVVSGQKLNQFHTADLQALSSIVPNVFVEETAGDNVIYIRGFGSPPANFSFDQSVSLYVDGVYEGRSNQAQSPFFDISRVEVLRGPQGALFGKNTPAGAVSIVTAGPTDQFEGEATGLYNFDLKGYDLSGYVSGPIAPGLTMRLAAKVVDEDGYIENLSTDHKDPETREQLARLTVRYAPNSTFDYTLKFDYGNTDRLGGMDVSSSLTGPQDPHLVRETTGTPLGGEGTKATSATISGTGNWKLGDFTLTSVTGYSTYHSNIVNYFDELVPGTGNIGIDTNSVHNTFPEHFNQESEEIRLLSPTGQAFEYIVGAYYDNSFYHLTQEVGFDLPALAYDGLLDTEFKQHAQTVSVFGQGTYHLLDNLRLVGSLRYTNNQKTGTFDSHLVFGPFPLEALTAANGKINENNVDPSVTLQYDVTRRVMLYLTYGRGSKSGGFVSNTFGTVNSTFSYHPETSENYEGGVKSTWFGGQLVADVSAYHTSFTNLQVSVFNPTTQAYLTGNAASASSTGVEASFVWRPVRNLDFTASGSYQDVTYDNYPGAACLATESLAQCDPSSPASIAANNIKGAPLAYTSHFTGNVQAHYRIDLPNDFKVDTTAIVSGRSKYFDSDDESPNYGVQPGYAKVDLRIQLAPADDRWHIAFVGKNLTDALTTGSAFNLPNPITAVPRAILYLDAPRNISIEAGFKF